MNAIQRKIQGTSRAIAILTKISYIALIIVVCFELAGIIWYMISPEKGSFMLGQVRFITPALFSEDQGGTLGLSVGIAAPSFLIAILILTNRIFRDISREYTPFLTKNIRRMKKIAILLLVSSVVSPAIDMSIRKSISSAAINTTYYNSEMIVLAIIIYCFALIFQYGAELQQQSDETL